MKRLKRLISITQILFLISIAVQFLPDKTWPVSLEAYSNHGALFYPSGTNYNAETDIYRELFLPGEDFYVLIRTYVQEISAFRGLKENLPEESFKRMR